MKAASPPPAVSGDLVRPDLIAILAYMSPCARSGKCVDGTMAAENHLSRLAAAARMQ